MAVEDQSFPDNITDLAKDLRPNLRGIALLNGASAYMQAEKQTEAAALYTQLADDKSIPDDLRSLGTLMSVRLSNDTISTDDKLAKLTALSKQKNDVWQPYGLLEKALILANEQQDTPAALAALNDLLQIENLPPSLQANAENLHHLYSIDVMKMEQK